jgi:hypothetical protein
MRTSLATLGAAVQGPVAPGERCQVAASVQALIL